MPYQNLQKICGNETYRFSEPNNQFYVAITTVHHQSPQEIWFKRNPVGVNKLSSMMKQMVERAGLNPDKNFTNHSARKHLVQKLIDFNVPANQIMQISGHKNIHSINNYSHINEDQHRQISEIFHTDAPSSNAALCTITTVVFTQLQNHENCF